MIVRGIVFAGTATDRRRDMRQFAQEVLGMTPAAVGGVEADLFDLPDGSSFAVASPGGMGRTDRSLGFPVDDLDAAVADLVRAGIPVDPHVSGNERERYVHFMAPDGQLYELVERRQPGPARGGPLRRLGRMRPVEVRRPRRVFVLGGARSGKSSYAEGLLARERAVDYVACGTPAGPDDPEWADRIALHRARRPASWRTVETLDLVSVLAEPGPPVLVDCLTTWLAGTMDECGVWSEQPGADGRLAAAVDDLLVAWARTRRRVVAVSNEVGNGIVPATPSGRRFRDELGVLNARIAAGSQRVWLLTAGLPQRLR